MTSVLVLTDFSAATVVFSAVSETVFLASSQETITAADAAQRRIDLSFIVVCSFEVAHLIVVATLARGTAITPQTEKEKVFLIICKI